MDEEPRGRPTRSAWSKKKRDNAPRGIWRTHKGLWAVRYVCGAGCAKHEETVGTLKSDAIRVYHARKERALSEPGWCPVVERKTARATAKAAQAKEQARVPFAEYATQYAAYAQAHKRSWRTDRGRIEVLVARFGPKKLDEITSLEIERFRDSLLETRAKATANRYRDLLSAIFKRAIRDGHLVVNPVKTVSKFKENNERVTYLTADEEEAVLATLPPVYRPHFLVSIHTGLRWSEQMDLRWRDVDLLTGFITVPLSKHGRARRVPMNSTVRSVLLDLGAARQRPDDPAELVFVEQPRESKVFFPKTVERAQEGLRAAGTDPSRLDDYTWHGNRHTFASRLIMAGVDPLTVKELGGWRTLAMVQRYAHLAPGHLHAAVERPTATELTPNFDPSSEPRPGCIVTT